MGRGNRCNVAARLITEKQTSDLPAACNYRRFYGGIMEKRKTISKKLRFEIFKRDGFQCAYCGQAPPSVILEVDHIEPKAKDRSAATSYFCGICWNIIKGKGRQ
jgi:5-methylcytosine-specific restriction endonuclease McrA